MSEMRIRHHQSRPVNSRTPLLVRVVVGCLLLLLLSVCATEASADPSLGLPVRCAPGDNCIIQKYVDTDPTTGHRDYRCGSLSSDGHKGTDFRITSLPDYHSGVAVLAMADGVVRATRDGMSDVSVSKIGREAVEEHECGNGVAIVHAEGYQTQYCHLRKGSVHVRKGDKVTQGQVIGIVGMSGLTEYPHVHVSLFKGEKVVDPFTGAFMDEGACNIIPRSLWQPALVSQLPYVRTGILQAFFWGEEPQAEKARIVGYPFASTLTPDATVLAFAADLFGPRAGDTISLKILYQGRRVLAEVEQAMPRDKAQYFLYIGRKRPAGGWPSGEYLGVLVLKQSDGAVLERTVRLRIQKPGG